MNTITINKKKDFIEYGVEVYFIENDTRLTDSVWLNKEEARERARELNSSNDVFYYYSKSNRNRYYRSN